MNQLIATPRPTYLDARQRVRVRVTSLLGTRRFLALPPRVQNAIVPPTFVLLGAMNIGCAVTGSGLIEERQHATDAFDSISLGDGFSGTVVIGEEYGLTVRADDNLMAYVRIEKSSGHIAVHLDKMGHRQSTLEAIFTMPRLAALSIDGRSRFDARNLVFADRLRLEARGGSELTIYGSDTSRVDQFALTNTGGSTCSVTVNADESLIEGSDSGRMRLQGQGKRMSLYLGGRNHLDAGKFRLNELAFRLSGDSTATVAVQDNASGRATGASTLAVSGQCELNAETWGKSAIMRV